MKIFSGLASAVLAATASFCCVAHAFDAAAERAERDRIKSERDQAEATFRARELECRQRFVVTPCLDQARRDRRQTMDRLRQQQEVLDEAQRKQRAALRVGEIQTKVSGDEARQREAEARERRKEKQRLEAAASASAASAAEVSQPASAASAAPAPKPQAHTPHPKAANDEAKRVADYERRQQEAQAHRDAVARRNAERATAGKVPSKGLPTPQGASAAH